MPLQGVAEEIACGHNVVCVQCTSAFVINPLISGPTLDLTLNSNCCQGNRVVGTSASSPDIKHKWDGGHFGPGHGTHKLQWSGCKLKKVYIQYFYMV